MSYCAVAAKAKVSNTSCDDITLQVRLKPISSRFCHAQHSDLWNQSVTAQFSVQSVQLAAVPIKQTFIFY